MTDPFGVVHGRGKNVSKAAKKTKDSGRATTGSAIAGAGAVTTGVSLVAGGVPGTTPNGNAIFRLKHLDGRGMPRAVAEVRNKGSAVGPAVHGGILGFRASVHEHGNKYFKAQNELDEQARRGNEPHVKTFYRGHNAGKIAPEEHIIRGMKAGRKVAHGALGAGVAATAYGVHRARSSGKVQKRDTTKEYDGALLGAGASGAAIAHGGGKYLGAQQHKLANSASAKVDEAGKLIPALDGRQGKKLTLAQMGRHQRKKPGAPYPKTMYPTVRDGDIKRNPKLLSGVPAKTVEHVGHLRGAAAQERHFSEVFGSTAKVVRHLRTPSAIVGAVGAGGLMAHKRESTKVKKMDENPFLAKADEAPRRFSHGDAEVERRDRFDKDDHNRYHTTRPFRKPETCKYCKAGTKVVKSVFGVDHEVEKGLSQILDGGMDALKGLKGGIKGGSFGAAPGSAPGMLGAKTGNSMRSGAKSFGRFAAKNPVGAAGAVAGGGAVGGYALSRPLKGNKN